jgi:hypothetical protein
MNEKECSVCNLILPTALFDKADGNGYIRNQCRQCRLIKLKEKREEKKKSIKDTPQIKECMKCNIIKSQTEFSKFSLSNDGLAKQCKMCYKETRHRKKSVAQNNTMMLLCEKCKITKSSSEFKSNAKSTTGFYKTCNSCWKPCEWNSEKQKASEKKYVLANPEKMKEKYKKDAQKPNRIIRDRLNKRIRGALESVNNYKTNSTSMYIGCNLKFLKKWFEYHFTDIMGWHNINEWHVDHVIPCEHYDLTNTDEQYKCFNWTNLRPCFEEENLRKSNKIIPEIIEKQKYLVTEFIKVNPLPNHVSDGDDGAN